MKPTESIKIDEDVSFLVGYANAISVPSTHIATIGGPVQLENFLIVVQGNLASTICSTAHNIQQVDNKCLRGEFYFLVDTVLKYGTHNAAVSKIEYTYIFNQIIKHNLHVWESYQEHPISQIILQTRLAQKLSDLRYPEEIEELFPRQRNLNFSLKTSSDEVNQSFESSSRKLVMSSHFNDRDQESLSTIKQYQNLTVFNESFNQYKIPLIVKAQKLTDNCFNVFDLRTVLRINL